MLNDAPETITASRPDVRPVAFGDRVVAGLFDLLATVLACIGMAFVGGSILYPGRRTDFGPGVWPVALAGAWVVPAVELATGRSPGKWLAGHRVRRTDGRLPSLAARVARLAARRPVLLAVTAAVVGPVVLAGPVGAALLPAGAAGSAGGFGPAARFAVVVAALYQCLDVLGAASPARRAAHDLITGTAVYDRAVERPTEGPATAWPDARAFEVLPPRPAAAAPAEAGAEAT